MLKKYSLIICLPFLFISVLFSTNVQIDNVRGVLRPEMGFQKAKVTFDLSWENAWKNEKNHDAVWIFTKFSDRWSHCHLSSIGHRVLKKRNAQMPDLKFEVAENGVGIMIMVDRNYRGNLDYKIELEIESTKQKIDWSKMKGFRVYGVEMVYIPEGPFTVGSPDTAAYRKAAFFKSDGNGRPDGLFKIASEQEIDVSPKAGDLYYWSEDALYNGDQKGPIPTDFPKGFDPFYIMKYELTQGQYADFLNFLPDNDTYVRSPVGGRYYHRKRGGIYQNEGKYIAESPDRPMNMISFTDGLAFTDWAGLRPITELEYEKAARGPSKSIPMEFVWGTDNYDKLERFVTSDHELILANGLDESQLNDQNRAAFGASYYWVMDLSGSVWEKVITVGNEIGRRFKGSHGDGLVEYGAATNDDWPKSDNEEGGFGYRGGGYYEIGTAFSEFNPHSPIGYRYYGAWSGGPRSIAYGYRAGRSAR